MVSFLNNFLDLFGRPSLLELHSKTFRNINKTAFPDTDDIPLFNPFKNTYTVKGRPFFRAKLKTAFIDMFGLLVQFIQN
jgi:hypothetical protein